MEDNHLFTCSGRTDAVAVYVDEADIKQDSINSLQILLQKIIQDRTLKIIEKSYMIGSCHLYDLLVMDKTHKLYSALIQFDSDTPDFQNLPWHCLIYWQPLDEDLPIQTFIVLTVNLTVIAMEDCKKCILDQYHSLIMNGSKRRPDVHIVHIHAPLGLYNNDIEIL